jgi:hypothetical protein
MSNYLLVTNLTTVSDELRDALDSILVNDPTAGFVLLVPTAPPTNPGFEDERARDQTRRVAKAASEGLQQAGYAVTWTLVSDETPVVALATELRDHPRLYAGVVFAAVLPDESGWLDRYLHRLAESLDVTLVHVIDREGVQRTLAGVT